MPNKAKPERVTAKPEKDSDIHKGAVESDKREDNTPASLQGQLPHRTEDPLIKGRDTDFPEPGENPEFSGESEEADLTRRRA